MLARAGIVMAIKEVAIFGQHQFGALPFWHDLDGGLGDGNLPAVQVHHIAIDDASRLARGRLHDIAIDAIKVADRAAGMAARQNLAAAFAKIELLFMFLPARQAGEPFGFLFFFCKGVEDTQWRVLPAARDGALRG